MSTKPETIRVHSLKLEVTVGCPTGDALERGESIRLESVDGRVVSGLWAATSSTAGIEHGTKIWTLWPRDA